MDIWSGVLTDFTDLGNASDALQVAVRMLTAIFLGGLLGFERELTHKAAGLRTHMLVCLGAALFVIVADRSDMKIADMSRVLQGVAAGVGFLGAGTILKDASAGDIKGLTTAAGIWLTAAVGVAAGMGRMLTAIMAAIFALIILSVMQRLSEKVA